MLGLALRLPTESGYETREHYASKIVLEGGKQLHVVIQRVLLDKGKVRARDNVFVSPLT